MKNRLMTLTLFRAIFDLSQGLPICLENNKEKWVIFAIDSHDQSILQQNLQYNNGKLLINTKRSSYIFPQHHKSTKNKEQYIIYEIPNARNIDKTLKIINIIAGIAQQEKIITNSEHYSLFQPIDLTFDGLELLEELAKIGEFLPAFCLFRQTTEFKIFNSNFIETIHHFSARNLKDAIKATKQSTTATIICDTTLKLKNSYDEKINARIYIFRIQYKEHYAIKIKNINTTTSDLSLSPPLIRIHSCCFTGDVLKNITCDCNSQLQGAIDAISSEDSGGVILYLNQEGRGIGLINKLRAYNLQKNANLDTVDANLCLGLEADSREFNIAATMLKSLNIPKIKLLTNNPNKATALASNGIEIIETISHVTAQNEELRQYYATKVTKLGHKNLCIPNTPNL